MSRPRALLPVGFAVLAVLIWVGPFSHLPPWNGLMATDIPTYAPIGQGLFDGRLPYRDLPLEYPPGAVLVFWIAALIPGGFEQGFEVLMAVVWAVAVAGGVVAAQAAGVTLRRQVGVGFAMAATPLLLGNLIQSRFDAVLAALLAWLLAAAVAGRWRWMWALLAAAFVLKLMPLVLVPVLFIWHAQRVSGRAAVRGLAGSAVLALLVLAPPAVLWPDGLWHVVEFHWRRPPQIESLASSYMLLLHNLADVPLSVVYSYGSQGLSGQGPSVIATLLTVATGVLVVAVAVVFRTGLRPLRPGAQTRLLICALACTMAVTVAGGKVLSPQFMLWLVPLVLLVEGPFGAWAFGTSLAAMVMTQTWFPSRYWDLVALHSGPIWLLVARNALLVALVAMLWPRPAAFLRPASHTIRPGDDPIDAPDRAISARYLLD